jgi:hypothetical protein
MRKDLDRAAKYRERAEQLRKIAKGIYDGEERKTLKEIADEYEQMARAAER